MRSQRRHYWIARRLRALALKLDAKALELEQRADLELELESRSFRRHRGDPMMDPTPLEIMDEVIFALTYREHVAEAVLEALHEAGYTVVKA